MTITKEFIYMTKKVNEKVEIPLISSAFFPAVNASIKENKTSNFGAIVLEDGSVGLMYLNLEKRVKKILSKLDLSELKGKVPYEIAMRFSSDDLVERALGLGAINAISQWVFRKACFSFDFTEDSLGLPDLRPNDVVGMVGLFPPLVRKIVQMGLRLVVVEKKKEHLRGSDGWEVTLDPRRLLKCTKILITSTTIMNDTIDAILENCIGAEFVSIIGPTGGFFPDPLFLRGVDVVGGSQIVDHAFFIDAMRYNKRWGISAKKYFIRKNNYPGFTFLLEKALKNINM
ncbi:MAG: hypothetical protein JW891_07610 [Candidatus Lokiarchaeota archaeon]|nr:hypothetical protein [Candidatus Lokiarchaeota archaeon]